MIMAAFTAADRVNTRWLSERASDGGGGGGAAALVAGSLTSWEGALDARSGYLCNHRLSVGGWPTAAVKHPLATCVPRRRLR